MPAQTSDVTNPCIRQPKSSVAELTKARSSARFGLGRDVDELRQNGLAGTPNELVDKIGRFTEIGCARIHLQLLDLEDVEHIELIAQEVMPHV